MPRRRVGGYSYRVPDVTGTYNTRNPPPYMHVRQTPSGPYDSGFFFEFGLLWAARRRRALPPVNRRAG